MKIESKTIAASDNFIVEVGVAAGVYSLTGPVRQSWRSFHGESLTRAGGRRYCSQNQEMVTHIHPFPFLRPLVDGRFTRMPRALL